MSPIAALTYALIINITPRSSVVKTNGSVFSWRAFSVSLADE